jgi:hypothetical protein
MIAWEVVISGKAKKAKDNLPKTIYDSFLILLNLLERGPEVPHYPNYGKLGKLTYHLIDGVDTPSLRWGRKHRSFLFALIPLLAYTYLSPINGKCNCWQKTPDQKKGQQL